MADILDFPSRAKPRVTDADALLFGEGSPSNVTPYGETLEEFKPISSLPRATFGLRPATGEALFNIPRAEDNKAQENIKRAAREARNAFDRKHVCPSLDASLCARITQLAGIASMLADEAKTLGHLKACNTLRDLAHHAETASAEIEAEFMPEPA